MPKFIKKPVVVEAIQYNDPVSVIEIMEKFGSKGFNNSPEGLYILTLEGTMKADKGDWIIRGVEGELYPCKSSIFEKTYMPLFVKDEK